MERYDRYSIMQQGVGATAEARLETISPLVEFYEREMGELPGRLMIATSFLGDMSMLPGYSELSLQMREHIENSHALVVSVMVRLLNSAGGGCICGESQSVADEVQSMLDEMSGGWQNKG